MNYKSAVLFSISILLGISAFSQQDLVPELITDRPDATESSVLIFKGSFQIELGTQFTNGEVQENLTFGTGLLRIGVLENLEFRLGLDYSRTKFKSTIIEEDINSLSPLLIGFKTGIAKENGILPEMALLGHLSLPYISESIETTGIDFRFAFSHTLLNKSGISYNLGAGWDGISDGIQYIYTLSYGYSINNNLGWYGEIYGDAPENAEAIHYLDTGLTYMYASNFQLDAYIGRAINNDPELILGAGFSFRIPN